MEVTSETFETEVLNHPTPVLVDFYAPWCQPCKMLAPAVDKMADSVKVVKVNGDNCHEILSKYNISAYPTLIFFKNGKEAKRLVGLVTEHTLRETLNNLL